MISCDGGGGHAWWCHPCVAWRWLFMCTRLFFFKTNVRQYSSFCISKVLLHGWMKTSSEGCCSHYIWCVHACVMLLFMHVNLFVIKKWPDQNTSVPRYRGCRVERMHFCWVSAPQDVHLCITAVCGAKTWKKCEARLCMVGFRCGYLQVYM